MYKSFLKFVSAQLSFILSIHTDIIYEMCYFSTYIFLNQKGISLTILYYYLEFNDRASCYKYNQANLIYT